MPTIVDIFNIYEHANNFTMLININIYEHDKFHAQLSSAQKSFITSGLGNFYVLQISPFFIQFT